MLAFPESTFIIKVPLVFKKMYARRVDDSCRDFRVCCARALMSIDSLFIVYLLLPIGLFTLIPVHVSVVYLI